MLLRLQQPSHTNLKSTDQMAIATALLIKYYVSKIANILISIGKRKFWSFRAQSRKENITLDHILLILLAYFIDSLKQYLHSMFMPCFNKEAVVVLAINGRNLSNSLCAQLQP